MIAGKRICSNCHNELPIVDGITTTLACQNCGFAKGKIVSDFAIKYLRFTCKTCGETFLNPVNREIELNHPICGGLIFTVETTADSVEVEDGLKKIKQKEKIDCLTSIIICTWNNLRYTKNCISSIRKKTKEPYQLVVVDNGSDDGSVGYIQTILEKDDMLICNAENKGFSAGNNQGMKFANGEYILLLNNDTIIKDEGWIEKLIVAERIGGGLVGVNLRRVERDDVKGMFLYQGDGDYKHQWCYLEGWCLLAKRTLFEELEGFDERFFCYSEDADLSFRVRKQLNLPLTEVKIPVDHIGQMTSSILERKRSGQSDLSNRLLYRKWISDKVKNILVVRKGAIGDVLYSTPILKALKSKYPGARIIYETYAPQLLYGNPYVDEIVEKAKEGMLFDKTYYLEYERRGVENLVDVMADQVGVKLKSRKLILKVPRRAIQKDICKARFGKKYVVFHTGHTWRSRQWDIENFNIVAAYLHKKGRNIVLVGDVRTPPLFDGQNAIRYYFDQRNCSWEDTIGIIDNCEFFVGLDSSPSVIAKALEKITFIIYGCVDPKTRYVDMKEYPLYDSKLECAGCRGRTSEHKVHCEFDTVKCLERITPMMAIQKIGRYIKSKERGEENGVSKRNKRRRG